MGSFVPLRDTSEEKLTVPTLLVSPTVQKFDSSVGLSNLLTESFFCQAPDY